MDALAKGSVDAVVHEMPILKYLSARRPSDGFRVLEGTFHNHGYAFALRKGSPLRADFNKALLTITESDEFNSILTKYLGERH